MGWMNLHGLKKAHFHYPCCLWDPHKRPWIRGIYRNKIFGHFSYKCNGEKGKWDHKRIEIGSRLHIVSHFSEHGYECSLSFPVMKGKIENVIILLQSIWVETFRSYEKYTYNEVIQLTSSTAHRGIPKFCFDGSHGRYLSNVVFLRKVDGNITASDRFVIVNSLKIFNDISMNFHSSK